MDVPELREPRAPELNWIQPQGDQAWRGGTGGKPAQPQRAIASDGERFEMARESKISVGGDPVRAGAEGVSAVPADRRVGRGLCLAEKPDLRTGPADQERETRLAELQDQNKKLSDQLADAALAATPGAARARIESGIGPPQPTQVWRLTEPLPIRRGRKRERQYAGQPRAIRPGAIALKAMKIFAAARDAVG